MNYCSACDKTYSSDNALKRHFKTELHKKNTGVPIPKRTTKRTTENTMLKSTFCIHPDCKVRASYNFVGKGKMYCSKHKQKGMVDVCHKLCTHPDCFKSPYF